jgi:hypothetical protein
VPQRRGTVNARPIAPTPHPINERSDALEGCSKTGSPETRLRVAQGPGFGIWADGGSHPRAPLRGGRAHGGGGRFWLSELLDNELKKKRLLGS